MNCPNPISHLIAKCQDRAREHNRSFEEIAMYRELAEALLELSRLRSSDAQQILDLVNQLRRDECSSVTLFNDNPDFNGQPNCVIEHRRDLDEYAETFRADTLKACLEQAVAKMKEMLA